MGYDLITFHYLTCTVLEPEKTTPPKTQQQKKKLLKIVSSVNISISPSERNPLDIPYATKRTNSIVQEKNSVIFLK